MALAVDYASWNEAHALPHAAWLEEGEGGLPRLAVRTPACQAEIYLHGAQVTRWQPAEADEDVLFLSSRSRWEEGKAIRGGIPICFPWFRGKAGAPQAPAHGLVRTRAWHLAGLTRVAEALDGDAIEARFVLASEEWASPWWNHPCELSYTVRAGRELALALAVTNTGTTPMRFEEALHAYLRVGDVGAVRVDGLEGATYLDNMHGNRAEQQAGPVRFTGQTDNAYLNTGEALTLVDPGLARQIVTEKVNSRTTVVWNPWAEGAATLADLGSAAVAADRRAPVRAEGSAFGTAAGTEAWREFACVEGSNILGAAVELAPGASHTLGVRLRVLPLA